MAKDNTLLFVALAAGAAFFIMKKGGLTRRGSVIVHRPETLEPGSEAWMENPDAVIDTTSQKISLPDAIEQAKAIIAELKDAKVVIKRPGKGNNVAIRGGAKRIKPTAKRKVKKLTPRLKKKAKKVFSAQNTAAAFTFL